jgi:acyl-coenzyme A thioesterase PaaI-like protein
VSVPTAEHPSIAAPPTNAPARTVADVEASPPALAEAKRVVTGRPRDPHRKRTFSERVEAYVSKLSTKNNFWHRVCSLIWLPFAFRSGIKMKRLDQNSFTAVLPFRRFNRNWYNAMAGAALLGNSEIAGGMYVFGICGGDYTVVCKHLEYKFLRPCFGPAVYRITPRENIQELLAHKGEFNITIDLDINQAITKLGEKEKRVGRCTATFHVTPKLHHKSKRERARTGPAPVAGATGETESGDPPPT